MATALGIAPDAGGVGVDPLTHRRVIASQWNNPGVVTGLAVTGRTDLRYDVAAGVAVCSRSAADGAVLAYWPGGQTPVVAAGNASNPRIDTIYLKANDLGQGDPTNQVSVGVAQGVASPTPVPPSLASIPGATPLASMRVPAGATRTNVAVAAASVTFAIPAGAPRGMLHSWTDTANGAALQTIITLGQGTLHFPTDRNLLLKITPCVSAVTPGGSGSAIYRFLVDGVNVGTVELAYTDIWATSYFEFPLEISAGTHTFAFARFKRSGVDFIHHYGVQVGENYPGTTFSVWDMGPAQ